MRLPPFLANRQLHFFTEASSDVSTPCSRRTASPASVRSPRETLLDCFLNCVVRSTDCQPWTGNNTTIAAGIAHWCSQNFCHKNELQLFVLSTLQWHGVTTMPRTVSIHAFLCSRVLPSPACLSWSKKTFVDRSCCSGHQQFINSIR